MRRVVLIVIGLVVLTLGSTAGGMFWWLGRAGPPPELLIQQANGNLMLVSEPDHFRPLTMDGDGRRHIYAFPVPSPDGRMVAYVDTLHETAGVTSSLVVHAVQGPRRVLFESEDSQPFYLYWSPDSRHIAFLAGEQQGMLLRAVNVLGEPTPQQVIAGQPSYFAWTPDSERLLLHTGGSAPEGTLGTWALGDTQPRTWGLRPGMFQAPSWIDDGHSAIAAIVDGPNAVLARLDAQGAVQQKLVPVRSGMLFVVSPSGKEIAYLPLSLGAPGNLHIVGVEGTNNREATTMPAISFWWSPDGTRIAYLTLGQSDDPHAVAFDRQPRISLTWHVLDVANGTSRSLKTFTPTEAFLNLLPFFDQYAHSIRLWDKEGRLLVYPDQDGIWTLDITNGATTRIGDGILGMWIQR
jgi:hypothetical protein